MLMSAAVPGNIGGLLGQSTSGKRLVTILKSRRVLGAMVDRFGLIEDYGASNRDLAMETLEELIETELSSGGTLKIRSRLRVQRWRPIWPMRWWPSWMR